MASVESREMGAGRARAGAPSAAAIHSQGAIMSVKKEASGRRSVQVEVEVPGTPEEVWQAIATGPGISSWFVPTEFEERDGKPVKSEEHTSELQSQSNLV